MAWYEELLRQLDLRRDRGAAYSRRAARLTFAELAPEVRARTLVVHTRDDRVVPVEEGRLLGRPDPGRAAWSSSSRRITSCLSDEPAWQNFVSELHAFLGHRARRTSAAEPSTSARESWRCLSWLPRGLRQRGDRRAAVRQRANGRAPPLEHLREARRLREGGAGRRRGALLAAVGAAVASSLRRGWAACRPPGRGLEIGWWHRCRQGRVSIRFSQSRIAGLADRGGQRWNSVARSTTTLAGGDEPVATHEIRGGGGLRLHAREWGNPDGPALLFVHGLVAERPLLDQAGKRRSRHRAFGSSPSTFAATVCRRSRSGRRALRGRPALGRRPGRQ